LLLTVFFSFFEVDIFNHFSLGDLMKKIVFVFAFLLTISFQINAQWFLKNPTIPANINEIFFISENIGWIVGKGFILKTTDDGVIWNYQAINQTANLKSVFFIDENHGWTVGEDGRILSSIDGGTNWIEQNSLVYDDLHDVKFLDNNSGWTVGYQTVLRTYDGGDNWIIKLQTVGQSFNSIYMINNDTCLVIGTTDILKTTDGGTTWDNIYHFDASNFGLPGTISINNSCFINNNIGWVVGTRSWYVPPMGHQTGIILRTEDGGITWEVQNLPANAIPFSYLLGVDFTDQNNGWVSGASGLIIHSTDGGLTWEIQNSGTTKDIRSIKFLNNLKGWFVADFSIMKSYDGGYSWLLSPNEPNITNAHLSAIDFSDNNNAWVTGWSGTILMTNNAGLNWFNQMSGTSQPLRAVQCIDTNTVFCSGMNAILKTTDSGNNWISQNTGLTVWRYLNSISFINENEGWIVGDEGTLLKTTDGGLTWIQYPFSLSENLSQVYFSSRDTGWVTVDPYPFPSSGKIFRTTNGGNSWVRQNNFTVNGLLSLFFLDKNTGWIGGRNGTLIKTTDGGENWIKILEYEFDGYDLYDLHFVSANVGCAVGTYTGFFPNTYGNIFKTNDGGDNWIEQLTPLVSNALTACYFLDQNIGWAVGEYGTIWETTNGGVTFVEEEENNSTQPKEFLLQQNYPNPFNPSTTIQYTISNKQFVTLKVYDLLGREVATLVNEEKAAGSYGIEFGVKSLELCSGIYFYKLQAGDFVETKKMILLK
jgi:photosystem II stability/assembly factor-like uncharacterized protein